MLFGGIERYFLSCCELQHLYGLLAVFAFHPSVSFLKIEVMIDCAANRALGIV